MHNYDSITNRSQTTGLAGNDALPAQTSAKENFHAEFNCLFPIQFKLSIGAIDDPLEDEADAVADNVMRMPEQNFIQRKCVHCEEEEKAQRKPLASFIQKKESVNNIASDNVSNQINSTKGSGNSLSETTKSFMESRFGVDFSYVNIHTGSYASHLSSQLNAQAFTVGNDIYFNEGKFAPDSFTGKHLLAHELTHTIQQNQSKPLNNFVQLKKRTGNPSTEQIAVLNNSRLKYTSSVYQRAVNDWPDDKSIWNNLKTPGAKEKFVRFVLLIDQTNCVIYDENHSNSPSEHCIATAEAAARFKNACQGYAAQMYSRYTSMGRVSATATSALQTEGNIVIGNVPSKLQIPIKIVTTPGHAFNSVLIGDNPQDLNAWLFFEPQTDEIFSGSDAAFKSEVGLGIFTIGRFTDYTNQFVPAPQEDLTFILDRKGLAFQYSNVTPPQRISLETVFRDIFIADDKDAYPFATTQHKPVQNYEQYVAGDLQKIPLADLALAFSYLDGKPFKRRLDGSTEMLNRRVFLQLLNRPGLENLIPEPQIPAEIPLIVNPIDEKTHQEQKKYESDLREAVIAPLYRSRPDATSFLTRLDSLSFGQRFLLSSDDTFFALVRKYFKGKSLWAVFSKLDYNDHRHEPLLGLDIALLDGDARLVADMLSIAISKVKGERFFAFLREVVLDIFKGNSSLPEILRLIDHRHDPEISERLEGQYKEVHYEEDKKNKKGGYSLEKFTGQISANAYFSGNELRVIVRMRFVDGSDPNLCKPANLPNCPPFLFSGKKYNSNYEDWQKVIKDYWNNKFSISNGRNKFNIVFVPLFLTEETKEAVTIRIMTDNSKSCSSDGKDPGRADQTCWFINDKDKSTVAHEFGHIIGASDEYRLPGSYQEVIKANFHLNQEDLSLTTVEGIEGKAHPAKAGGYPTKNSVMNDDSNNVQTRHLTRLLRLLNSGLPAETPPFIVLKK